MNASEARPAVVADRYELQTLLGRGAHGEVWRAQDRVVIGTVAVKLLYDDTSGRGSAWIRREIATLRRLRLPGVVRLLDDGIDAGRSYIVTEFVEGAPFPGHPTPRAWLELRETVTSLVDVLARVHAAGVIHRDLKPANVLVDPQGRPTVVDFGVAHADFIRGPHLTSRHEVVGTPAYLAPEQMTGEEATPRTDLYSLGLILYEALVGEPAHRGADATSLLRSRLTAPAPSLRDRAPAVPATVAHVIDRLLAIEPSRRPASASDVASLLRGEAQAQRRDFPWLGPRSLVDRATAAALSGAAVRLTGGAGMGKSRMVLEIAQEVEAAGRRTIFLPASRRAFSSLEPLLPAGDDETTAEELREAARQGLVAARCRGDVVLVDDAAQLDFSTRAILGVDSGAMVGAPDGTAEPLVLDLRPLPESALSALFAGPERVHHLKPDAARLLHARTGGVPGSIVEEISMWEAGALVRWDGAVLRMDRDAIEHLEAGLAVGVMSTAGRGTHAEERRPFHLDDMLEWIWLGGNTVTAEVLARAMREPRWRVTAELDELCCTGAVILDGAGQLQARIVPASVAALSPVLRRERHERLAAAFEAGTAGRMSNLLAASAHGPGSEDVVLGEAVARATRLAAEGRLGNAQATLAEAVHVASRQPRATPALVERVFGDWVHAALADMTAAPLDRVHYELARTSVRTEVIDNLELLVRAGLGCSSWTGRPLALARQIASFRDERLERDRQFVLITAARRGSLPEHEAVMEEVARWATSRDNSATQAAVSGWWGRLRYRQERFDESARLHDVAAEGEELPTSRVGALLNSASSLIEIPRLDEAVVRARRARDAAAAYRHVFLEARAEWLLRCIEGRRPGAPEVDHELVEAVEFLRFPEFEANVCVIEAGIALRAGDRETARRLATQARRVGKGGAEPMAILLADAIFAAGGGELSDAEAGQIAARSIACPRAAIGAQALALLARAGRLGWIGSEAGALIDRLPPDRASRREVMSLDEALAVLHASGAIG